MPDPLPLVAAAAGPSAAGSTTALTGFVIVAVLVTVLAAGSEAQRATERRRSSAWWRGFLYAAALVEVLVVLAAVLQDGGPLPREVAGLLLPCAAVTALCAWAGGRGGRPRQKALDEARVAPGPGVPRNPAARPASGTPHGGS